MCFSTSPRSWNLQKILKLKTLWSKKMLKVHSIVGTVTQKLSWIKSNTTTTIFTITKTTTIVNKFTLRESFGFFSFLFFEPAMSPLHPHTHTHKWLNTLPLPYPFVPQLPHYFLNCLPFPLFLSFYSLCQKFYMKKMCVGYSRLKLWKYFWSIATC